MQPNQPDPVNNSFNPIPPAPGTDPQSIISQHNPLVQMTGEPTFNQTIPTPNPANPSITDPLAKQPSFTSVPNPNQDFVAPPIQSNPLPASTDQNFAPINPQPGLDQPGMSTIPNDINNPPYPTVNTGLNNPIGINTPMSTAIPQAGFQTNTQPNNIDNLPLSSLGSQSNDPQPGLSGLHASSPANFDPTSAVPPNPTPIPAPAADIPIPTPPPASEPFDPNIHQVTSGELDAANNGNPLGNFDPNAVDLSNQSQNPVGLDSINSSPVSTQPLLGVTTPTAQTPDTAVNTDDLDFDDDLDGFAPPISNRPDIKKIGIIAGGALLGFLGIILIVVSLLGGSNKTPTPTPTPVTTEQPDPEPEPTPAELEQAQASSLEKITRTTIASGLVEIDRYCFNFVMRADNSLSSSKDCKLDTTYGQKKDNDFIVQPLKGEYETLEKVISEWKQEQASNIEIVKEQETLLDSVEAMTIIYKPATSSSSSTSNSSQKSNTTTDTSKNRSVIIVKSPILYLYNGSSYGAFVIDGSFGEEFAQLNYTDIIKSWQWKLPTETTQDTEANSDSTNIDNQSSDNTSDNDSNSAN